MKPIASMLSVRVVCCLMTVSLIGCGGGSTTTVIEKTVEPGARAEHSSQRTFLKAVAFEHLYVEPETYPFSADGSLVGVDLSWERVGLGNRDWPWKR